MHAYKVSGCLGLVSLVTSVHCTTTTFHNIQIPESAMTTLNYDDVITPKNNRHIARESEEYQIRGGKTLHRTHSVDERWQSGTITRTEGFSSSYLDSIAGLSTMNITSENCAQGQYARYEAQSLTDTYQTVERYSVSDGMSNEQRKLYELYCPTGIAKPTATVHRIQASYVKALGGFYFILGSGTHTSYTSTNGEFRVTVNTVHGDHYVSIERTSVLSNDIPDDHDLMNMENTSGGPRLLSDAVRNAMYNSDTKRIDLGSKVVREGNWKSDFQISALSEDERRFSGATSMAQNGSVDGMRELAIMHLDGNKSSERKPNSEQFTRWMTAAATQGDLFAQNQLGVMYSQGFLKNKYGEHIMGRKDIGLGRYWLQKAVEGGFDQAAKNLVALQDNENYFRKRLESERANNEHTSSEPLSDGAAPTSLAANLLGSAMAGRGPQTVRADGLSRMSNGTVPAIDGSINNLQTRTVKIAKDIAIQHQGTQNGSTASPECMSYTPNASLGLGKIKNQCNFRISYSFCVSGPLDSIWQCGHNGNFDQGAGSLTANGTDVLASLPSNATVHFFVCSGDGRPRHLTTSGNSLAYRCNSIGQN